MQKIKAETESEYFSRLIESAKTLTKDQIAACAWVMGGSGCQWDNENIVFSLACSQRFIKEKN